LIFYFAAERPQALPSSALYFVVRSYRLDLGYFSKTYLEDIVTTPGSVVFDYEQLITIGTIYLHSGAILMFEPNISRCVVIQIPPVVRELIIHGCFSPFLIP